MGRLYKFFQLPPRERLFLVQAWVLFFLLEPALRFLPFTRVLTFCTDVGRRRQAHHQETLSPVPRLARLVEIAGRYIPLSATCLKQALVLSWLLKRRGVATTLQIGVAHREGAFTAHAWLEYNGQVVFRQQERDGFAPLVPVR